MKGYAPPVGGSSYGGYMTNWLITQTMRFKAAVTGAGAGENAGNWGYDDLSFDDAWYLTGTPWEQPEIYQGEAALFQINKVTTPTHIVGGNTDNRVSFFDQVVLERALQRLNVPHTLLRVRTILSAKSVAWIHQGSRRIEMDQCIRKQVAVNFHAATF